MGYDEVDVRILPRDQLDDRNLADRIIDDGDRKGPRHLADLSGEPRIVPVGLDADEAILLDSHPNHLIYAALVPGGVNEGHAVEALGSSGDDARDSGVCCAIVGVEGRKQHGPGDARFSRTPHVLLKRRVGVPGTGKTITLSGMAMAVDDHDGTSKLEPLPCRSRRSIFEGV
jgi:hypothetical protein